MQQFPPRLLFVSPVISRVLLAMLPLLVMSGVAKRMVSPFMKRLARGVTDVRLDD
jgi:hypothetical protein